MKTKEQYSEEYVDYLYGDIQEHHRPIYAPDIQQSKQDFKAGFDLAEELFKSKWKKLEDYPPEEDTQILCCLLNRWADEVSRYSVLTYFQNNLYGDITEDEVVEKYMDIPK